MVVTCWTNCFKYLSHNLYVLPDFFIDPLNKCLSNFNNYFLSNITKSDQIFNRCRWNFLSFEELNIYRKKFLPFSLSQTIEFLWQHVWVDVLCCACHTQFVCVRMGVLFAPVSVY